MLLYGNYSSTTCLVFKSASFDSKGRIGKYQISKHQLWEGKSTCTFLLSEIPSISRVPGFFLLRHYLQKDLQKSHLPSNIRPTGSYLLPTCEIIQRPLPYRGHHPALISLPWTDVVGGLQKVFAMFCYIRQMSFRFSTDLFRASLISTVRWTSGRRNFIFSSSGTGKFLSSLHIRCLMVFSISYNLHSMDDDLDEFLSPISLSGKGLSLNRCHEFLWNIHSNFYQIFYVNVFHQVCLEAQSTSTTNVFQMSRTLMGLSRRPASQWLSSYYQSKGTWIYCSWSCQCSLVG